MSLRTAHPWAEFSVTPDDKAAGVALARFGGFLKRSWRMNDWTWGRLDAVTMLCQTVLDPQRLQRIAAMTDASNPRRIGEEIFRQLKDTLYGDATLPGRAPVPRARSERGLLDAVDPDLDSRHLPALAQWAALPLQAEIILEELPVVAAAIDVDTEEGAGRPTRGTRFLHDRARLLLPADRRHHGAELQRRRNDTEPISAGMRVSARFRRRRNRPRGAQRGDGQQCAHPHRQQRCRGASDGH